jgi:hypothetical protein
MSKVKIVSDENGNVVTISSNNPEFAWIILEQNATQMENGWLRKVTKKARIMGKTTDLVELKYTKNTELPGKIVVVESLTPFNSSDSERDLKIAGDTGVICRVNDQPIYRRTFYTSDSTAEDVYVQHTNSDEIKQVQKALNSVKGLKIPVNL